ncbi:hypothetical protein [Bacillus pseudomycoides]|uniref:hypothetical protein n=1 Tax=Bacillus pseudomycoides TaxID=64104 RepID=UPI000BEB4238|nr:hypothetical protein [Bacillus pseudomycoides]PEB42293.1 hypothetical protein COO06_08260 [Bacillus pseudomycoides]
MSKTSEKELTTSSLLFDEAPLLVRPEMASRIGLNEAIVIQQIHYWLENKRKTTKEKDLKNERTYRDQRFWCYNSYTEWQEQFPFWSTRTIERIFTNLEKNGLLISDCFNEWKADRTKWYTIDYDALDNYKKTKKNSTKKNKKESIEVVVEQSANLAESTVEQPDNLAESTVEQSDKLTLPIRQVDVTNPTSCGDEPDKLWSPIPENTTKNTTENTTETSLNSSSSIESRKIEDNNSKSVLKEEEEEINEMQLDMLRTCLIETLGNETPIILVNEIINHIKSNALIKNVCKNDIQHAYRGLIIDSRQKQIYDKAIYLGNGIIKQVKNRLLTNTNTFRIQLDEKKSEPYTGKVPLYNWLEQ